MILQDYIERLPDTPEARAQFVDTFEGRIVRSLTEYRYNIKKHKNRMNNEMNKFDQELRSHYETQLEDNSKCLLGAFLKLKEHEVGEYRSSVARGCFPPSLTLEFRR